MKRRWFEIALLMTACIGTFGRPRSLVRRTRRRWPITWALAWPRSSTTAAPATCPPRKGPTRSKRGRTIRLASGSRRCDPSSRKRASPPGIPARSRRSPTKTATATAFPTCSSSSPAIFPVRPTTGRRPASSPKVARPSPRLRRAQSGYAWNPFERVIRPATPGRPISRLGAETRSITSSPPSTNRAGSTPRPEASRPVLLRRLYLDLTGSAARARLSCTPSWPTNLPTPTSGSSIDCWPVRGMASAGDGTGWTCGATATGPAGASRSATASRTSGTGATGSSSRSIATSRTIA